MGSYQSYQTSQLQAVIRVLQVPTMPKFKIGDRVFLVKEYGPDRWRKDMVGTVDQHDTFPYVIFDNGQRIPYREHELMHLPPELHLPWEEAVQKQRAEAEGRVYMAPNGKLVKIEELRKWQNQPKIDKEG